MADNTTPDIIYTKVDEAPELASASFLPMIQKFAAAAGVSVGTKDISLAGRIISTFPEYLSEEQRIPDDLALLGELVKTPEANVIKLPNISASVPQLVAAVKELQAQGYALPDYPEEPATDEEKAVRAKYDGIKGSAVNPVLREGNSDRRAAIAVKKFAQANPHRMGEWTKDSKTRVASMSGGDFFSNEVSATLDKAATAKIVLETASGETVLKEGVSYPAGTVVDATYMSAAALDAFLEEEIAKTKDEGVLFSLHMKATMMKVSDPIIFGHAVKAYLKPVFDKYGAELKELGVNPNSGLGDLLARVEGNAEIKSAIDACMADQPPMYMVNSDKGITNLHVPSDVIIDASMPALIRAGGKGWGPDGNEADAVCVIPDNSYAPVYDETIKFFKENGKLNPATAGTVQNIGLMAQKAEEYGSHPTTFEIAEAGTVKMILDDGTVLHSHEVQAGDIWRSASARKAPIEDWVNLAIERQKAEGCEAIFWLDEDRAHDAQLIAMVKPILEAKGVAGKFQIMSPAKATVQSLKTITAGKNSIAITGNVLRDYLTDLFPILELATSAKMLSIVKLMQGGGLFETGAGGSAPKHVQQLQEESHLRWDSLGEFCALGESFKFLADVKGNEKARILGEGVDIATQGILDHDRSPSRKVGEPDNRDSHYWFARYWAEALARQDKDGDLADFFAPIAEALVDGEADILAEIAATQGKPADLGGYYHTDADKVASVMRPSKTLNEIIG
ncbi:MAG: NADP-dependent isocitrate dehydrogenase [Pseudomonadota bacterium]|uniref:NADP-dependent isocitrate dehydrogenase n=1 Tax=Pseudooceanicola nitratireducens TaxID=517719 RepID=UPI001C96DF70|nr:NADP-dependent isocitrate dehydrogenase [Pseudooceanicola nitratireducens]MBY6165595.1 NADP-dependent isocitrate dehydrogenase [Pseudooceanicola nitratireducens]MEC7297199.1 NADP-dependent isocitrate dehydrogenase [Pseudomonadota bacterium]MEC7793437.1 NADP-dependent isocitrate dehydrogenase [Pseudomonadota bacterium]MEC8668344.1 NADP-dependent isocitrate dehydrogenase [Pseudomonadota bacterium]|eukprot:g18159.t1